MASSQAEWKTASADEALVAELADALGLPAPLARVLTSRGFETPGAARAFLDPRLASLGDPFVVRDMDVAVDRIWAAIAAGERVSVFGDYDADGVTSTALLTGVLGQLGAQVLPFLPDRVTDGYGFTVSALERCLEQQTPGLIVTVDCGVCSGEAVLAAQQAGVAVVVTDHHEISGRLAPAVAVLNPKRGEDESLQLLAGVGVAFKLCHALVKAGREHGRRTAQEIDLREWLEIVALGTVADIVPLLAENRILVKSGLAALARTTRPGLVALLDKTNLLGKRLRCHHVGFVLGPRLNAAGRLASAGTSLELLLSTNRAESERLAGELDKLNAERRAVEDEARIEAERDLDASFDPDRDFGLVVAGKGWHIGTVGIVASRLVTKYRRPTIVIAIDENGDCRGSGRSIERADLLALLDECSDLLVSHGGHKAAAGLHIEERNVEAFKVRFNEVAARLLQGTDMRPVLTVGAWLDSLGEADADLLKSTDRLRPFGIGNPEPLWGVRGVRLVGAPRTVGKDGAHLKLTLTSGGAQIGAIGFGMGQREIPDGELDIVFQLRENTYQGRTELQLQLKDFRASV